MKKLLENLKEEYGFLEPDEKFFVWAVIVVLVVLLPYKIFMENIT